MYPDPDDPVAVTLEECEDLPADEGVVNGWELAARFAARMLPQIFRLDSPVFQLRLPPEHQQKLERLVAQLPLEVFSASDSLGWVYQFWQAKKKDEVNASEVKIGARELPAVTQLFTEPYMVSFLLDNSLGAWWAARRLSEADLKNAGSEEELRRKAAIPGVSLAYLRFVKIPLNPPFSKGDLNGVPEYPPLQKGDLNGESESPPLQKGGKGGFIWTPAAGTFDDWPEQLADLKTLDPCCGSGHFLVAAFLMLVPMRMERDGLSAKQAVDAVLRENIHGLELDQRCVELAAFTLALMAWKYPGAGGYRVLPELNVACSGLSVSVAKEEWKQLGMGKKNLTIALEWMHDTFKDAPVLGSLLNPAKTDAAKLVQWDELSGALEQALKQEQTEERHEVAVVAQGLAKAATLLTDQYQWVITNVPHLVRGKQNERLRYFCEKYYSAAKNDLATVFLDRCLELCAEGGTSSIVLPQNWLFLTSYKKFREKLLKNDTWHLIARLGPGAFETISGEVVKAILISLSRGNSTKYAGGLFGHANDINLIRGVDVSEARTAAEKATGLPIAEIKSVEQAKQLENPDARINMSLSSSHKLINQFADTATGIQTFDRPRFMKMFWEQYGFKDGWEPCQSTVDMTRFAGGCEFSILWEEGVGQLFHMMKDKKNLEGYTSAIWKAGSQYWGEQGVLVSLMGDLPVSLYLGNPYDQNAGLTRQLHKKVQI